MIKAIFLDMDDTLIVNMVLYEHAEAKLYGYLRHFGVLQEDAERVYAAKDKELFATHGYSRTRMPSSFETVLKHFVPDADEEMVAIVRDFAETIFSTVAKLKPGTSEAIDLLTRNYPVYVVTQGDRGVQENRLSHLPFRNELSGAFIVEKKNKEVYADLAERLGYAPAEIVMMGDSLKSDIIPSVAAGLQAVWIEAHNSPLHETAKEFPAERAYKFSSLLEASRHIVQNGTPAAIPLMFPPPARKNSAPRPK